MPESEKLEENVPESSFTTARVERKYYNALKARGMSVNELVRDFCEGKIGTADKSDIVHDIIERQMLKNEVENLKEQLKNLRNMIVTGAPEMRSVSKEYDEPDVQKKIGRYILVVDILKVEKVENKIGGV